MRGDAKSTGEHFMKPEKSDLVEMENLLEARHWRKQPPEGCEAPGTQELSKVPWVGRLSTGETAFQQGHQRSQARAARLSLET